MREGVLGRGARHLASVRASTRLAVACFAAAFAYFMLPQDVRSSGRVLIAWDIGISAYLIIVWLMVRRSTPADIVARAQQYGDRGLAVVALPIAAAGVSISAIIIELAVLKTMAAPAPHLLLAALTIALSWTFTQVMFALHYAHMFHRGAAAGDGGGLAFPNTPNPGYGDFLYFSFVIGCTSQTSDVTIESGRMRRLAMIHGIFAFFFNIVVLALSINIGATAI